MKTRIFLMIAVFAALLALAPVLQAVVLDDMDNIAARPWTDDRDGAGQGIGWLSQGAGTMQVDYGVTYDHLGIAPYNQPEPLSGWDYQDNFVGVGVPGGVFGDPALNDAPYGWGGGKYYGDYDRVPSAPFTLGNGPGLMPNLVPLAGNNWWFELDVYKTVANSPEHIRELQLYDSTGARNTYQVQAEATASNVGAGWKTYIIPLNTPLEDNANLADIVNVKLWFSSWSAYVSGPGQPPVWPDDYTIVRPTGTPVLADNLILVPEPATMTMLVLGGLALLRRRRA